MGCWDTSQNSPKRVESLIEEGVSVVKVACGECHTVVLSDDGEVLTCGVGEYGRTGLGKTSDSYTFEPVDCLEEETVMHMDGGMVKHSQAHLFSVVALDCSPILASVGDGTCMCTLEAFGSLSFTPRSSSFCTLDLTSTLLRVRADSLAALCLAAD